jgi:hypothetical protein
MALHPLHNCTDSTLPTKTNKTKRNEAKQNETKATRRFRQCVGIEARETASKTGHLAIHSAAQRSAAQHGSPALMSLLLVLMSSAHLQYAHCAWRQSIITRHIMYATVIFPSPSQARLGRPSFAF